MSKTHKTRKPRVFHYTDWEGKSREYLLKIDDVITKSKCPMDNTRLIATTKPGSRIWDKDDVFYCPFCGHNFYSIEPERLEHSKRIIIHDLSERLAKAGQEQKYFSRLLEISQSQPKCTNKPESYQQK